MAGRRLPRLNEQLKRDIAELLRTGVRDPRVAGVTVTDVTVTNDLSLARVYVRIAGGEAEMTQALTGLEAAGPFIRRSVGDGMRIRRVPELRFEVDESGEHAARIEAILREVVPPGGFPPEEPESEVESDVEVESDAEGGSDVEGGPEPGTAVESEGEPGGDGEGKPLEAGDDEDGEEPRA